MRMDGQRQIIRNRAHFHGKHGFGQQLASAVSRYSLSFIVYLSCAVGFRTSFNTTGGQTILSLGASQGPPWRGTSSGNGRCKSKTSDPRARYAARKLRPPSYRRSGLWSYQRSIRATLTAMPQSPSSPDAQGMPEQSPCADFESPDNRRAPRRHTSGARSARA